MNSNASLLTRLSRSAGPWCAATADLLLGARCHGCGEPGRPLCERCRQVLSGPRPSWTRPRPCPTGFPLTVTAGPYEPVVRALISAHKERQAQALTPVLGARLASSVELLLDPRVRDPADGSGPVVLVPAPSSAAAVRARGFDATAALARVAAGVLRRQGSATPVVVVSALAQRRGVRDQSGLDSSARHTNLAGGMCLRTWPLWGRRALSASTDGAVIVVDDLVTTGATLVEAVRVLELEGIRVRGAATVAATVRSTGLYIR